MAEGESAVQNFQKTYNVTDSLAQQYASSCSADEQSVSQFNGNGDSNAVSDLSNLESQEQLDCGVASSDAQSANQWLTMLQQAQQDLQDQQYQLEQDEGGSGLG